MEELEKTYNPAAVEGKIYDLWLKNKSFKPEANPDGKPFCIIMPPPNANGSLHIGHAVGITLEDIMIRYARMKGQAALWLPGADHAGFETQVVFEKKLEKEGRSRFKMSREDLYQETLEFTLKNKETMRAQIEKLGASCDWEREKFTLDEDIKKIVYQNFAKLYDDGLAYRALRSVNWCTKHQTTLSDLEVKYVEQKDPLYYIKYGPLTLATVRPETKFGDTAVAVNPKDKRYLKYIGQEIEIETVLGRSKIKVIADDYVDQNFGTGVVKITPAHDPNDHEIAGRHGLEIREVIDQYGRMNEKAGPYAGLKIAEAREKVVADMQKKGLIEKIDPDYVHTVGTCYKCGRTVEPRVLKQWFLAVTKKSETGKNLAADAVAAVDAGKVKFVTKKFEKIYRHWMKNIRDWNISRQIAWGIQIPAWYKESKDGEEIRISEEKPAGEGWIQDTDVFDTWFSSCQWPFAALMTTGKETDFDKFYPTSVMETAWDILFFWVARMIMFGVYFTGKVPFENVYIHGLVRDQDRQKMSKSKGNVIDPLGVTELYGTDAVRMALVFGTAAGSDIIISEDKIRGMRNFANKIWNISRFVLSNIKENPKTSDKIKPATEKDHWILAELEKTKKQVTKFLESYRFSQAGEAIYEFSWHKLADIYLESAKKQFEDDKLRVSTEEVLLEVLSATLTMLHPFMPFITEEIWSKLPESDRLLITSNWV